MNPKTKKILIVVAVVLLAGGVGFYFYRRKKSSSLGAGNDPFKSLVENKVSEGETVNAPTKEQLLTELENDNSFPLKIGSKGKRVEQLQRFLISEKQADLPQYGVDGNWGTETEAVVREKLAKDNVSKDYFIKAEMYLQPIKLS